MAEESNSKICHDFDVNPSENSAKLSTTEEDDEKNCPVETLIAIAKAVEVEQVIWLKSHRNREIIQLVNAAWKRISQLVDRSGEF